MRDASDVELGQAGRVVEYDAVQVPDTHDDLQGMAHMASPGEGDDDGPAEGPPYNLKHVSASEPFAVGKGREAYHREGLDTKHERIRGQVARIGECILLPELGKERLHPRETPVVPDEVPWIETLFRV